MELSLAEKGEKGIFDGEAARKGYAMNKLCYSLNREDARMEFLADIPAYCRKFGLNAAQTDAIIGRNRIDFVMAGGSLYFYSKMIRLFPEAGAIFAYEATVKGTEN